MHYIKKENKKINEFEKRFDNFNFEIERIEKGISLEVKEAELWMIQRKKFIIKLLEVIILILILLLISQFFL